MKLIKRPDFNEFRTHGDLSHLVVLALEQWFDVHLKDHYAVPKSDLVRVWSDSTGFLKSQYTTIHYHGPEPNFKEKAYLIKSSIEPIKKCEHARFWAETVAGENIIKCRDCGANLKPTGWTEVSDGPM